MNTKKQEIGSFTQSKLKLAMDDALRTPDDSAVKSSSIIVREPVIASDPVILTN